MSKTTAHPSPGVAGPLDDTPASVAAERGVAQGWRAYRALWPMVALLVGEVLATASLAPQGGWGISLASFAATIGVLLAGILPALLRPSVETNLVGCFAVALASVLWRAPAVLSGVATFDALALADNNGKLGLLNIMLLAPLTLHLAARFPARGPLATRSIVGYYILIVGLALLAWTLPMPARQAALVVLVLSAYAGVGLAGYQFLRTIWRVQPTAPRAAQQARLLLLSLALAETPFLLLPFKESIQLFMPYEAALGAQIVLPIGVAYSLLRHDVFGIDAALRRTLDYAIVSFGLLVIYFGLTTLLTQFSQNVGGTWGLVATVMSVTAAAAAFTPLRRVTQRLIDQAFYPERRAFGQAISAARATLAQVVQRDAVVAFFEGELPRQVGATWARLVLRPSFDQPEAASQPGVWSTLLLVGGQPLGCYWLGPRRSGLKYATDEREQLHSLMQQAALVLAYADTFDTLVQLNHELEERVATRTTHVLAQQRELAAFEERQRLARDLHDSVKQTLFSLGLGLRSARARVRSDPDAAVALLQQQEQEAIQAQAEMGDLLAQLRTAAADSADLVKILTDYCGWLTQQHELEVTLRMPPAMVLPEPLPHELAQVAKEALHNVLRHSGATRAQLTLTIEDGQLILTVADHGRGFDAAAPARGYGLRGMRERIAALGGRLMV
ncbi:MAG: hypothetical protein H7Y32_20475, partial [Chloroflexales bacterium]|nr:hypothetical protein [Chloroflexales bacterium]